MNYLKKINDTFGHNAGDALISCMAETLKELGERENATVATRGGDEFAALLPVSNSAEHAERQCIKFKKTVEERFQRKWKAWVAKQGSNGLPETVSA